MPTVDSPVKSSLKGIRARLASEEKTRKWYRLRVVVKPSEDATPAPFYKADISIPESDGRPSRAFTFAQMTEATVPDERNPEKTHRVEKVGAYDRLSESEVAALKARIEDYVVEWKSRPLGIALIVDTKTDRFRLNADVHEPLDQWLSVEGPLSEKP